MQEVINYFQQIDFMGILKWLFAFLVGDGGLLALMTFILTLKQNKSSKSSESNSSSQNEKSTPQKGKSTFLKNAAILLVGFILLVGINVVIYMFVPKPEPTDFSYAVKEDNTVCIIGLLNKDLSDYEIPATIKGHDVTEIRNGAFKDCDNMTSIKIPETVNLIGTNSFDGCDSLIFITVDEKNKNYTSENGVLFNKNKTNMICYPDGNKKGNVVASGTCGAVMDWTLYENGLLLINGSANMDSYANSKAPWDDHRSEITSVIINGPVNYIGVWAFRKCDRMTSITLPSSVSKIDTSAFSGCTSLTSIVIPNVASISGATFVNCSSLSEVTIPDSVNSIGAYAFGHL